MSFILLTLFDSQLLYEKENENSSIQFYKLIP